MVRLVLVAAMLAGCDVPGKRPAPEEPVQSKPAQSRAWFCVKFRVVEDGGNVIEASDCSRTARGCLFFQSKMAESLEKVYGDGGGEVSFLRCHQAETAACFSLYKIKDDHVSEHCFTTLTECESNRAMDRDSPHVESTRCKIEN